MGNNTAACVHDIVQDGFCTNCKRSVNTQHESYIPYHYPKKGLKYRPEYVGIIKRRVWEKSLKEKKLTLVLNLHDTLYDSRAVSSLSEKEKYLTESKCDDDMWLSKNGEVLYKLRPYARVFLREANKLFEMHVYESTCDDMVLSLLDPQGTYFGKRIIKNESGFKNLDRVLADERGVVILDDKSAYWWPDDRANLLQIRHYNYFKRCINKETWVTKLVDLFKTRHQEFSYAEERGDEDAEDGGLANALELLKEVHRRFFTEGDQDLSSRHVRAFLSF
ncbi:unnamed protein product [Eruca vesicaria subsp. sativa]|uniref:protein-serine/threonine phosphatase n=1 Tax=Eruca vesicaria subsp. sativa TaxID=29727 RepID=A0ABC8L0A0_ERUVS|nr:unnamed protein product [Eruca vesicaria subsp. sativa]